MTTPTTAELAELREKLIAAVKDAHDRLGLVDPDWIDSPENNAAVVADAVLDLLAAARLREQGEAEQDEVCLRERYCEDRSTCGCAKCRIDLIKDQDHG